jgi:ribosomal protein S18 acetylase RimI-like enzyme
MAAMVRRMKEAGVKLLLLDTEETNTGAIEFFRRNGFETTSRRQVWMWRSLGRKKMKRPPL